MKIGYRARQFQHALTATPAPQDCQEIEIFLPPALLILFKAMKPDEQAHSISIYHSIKEKGIADPDLLVAALLHDAGKNRLPLRLWERVYIVLAKALAPDLVENCGQAAVPGRLPFWQRALAVAVQHPEWGAQMADDAGASNLTIDLIRCHQVKEPAKHPEIPEHEVELLVILQSCDNAF